MAARSSAATFLCAQFLFIKKERETFFSQSEKLVSAETFLISLYADFKKTDNYNFQGDDNVMQSQRECMNGMAIECCS
jgi:hypothetical protein